METRVRHPTGAAAVVVASGARRERGQIRCRNHIRGNCRWGANCQFSHESVPLSAQICRNFQRGYCYYGDRCRYAHVHAGEGGASGFRRGSEPAIQSMDGRFATDRRGSEPVLMPMVGDMQMAGAGRLRRGSEPPSPNLMQLNGKFEHLNMGIQEDVDEDKENSSQKKAPENWAMASEFVPRQFPRQRGSQDLGAEALQLSTSDSLHGKVMPSSSCETSRAESSVVQHPPSSKAISVLGINESSLEKSREVICGICMDKVHEKSLPEERCFGILPNCNHPYCLSCIRKWRNSKDFKNEIIKSCPECRVKSSYYIPNKHWVSEENEKRQLIENFKAKTSKIRCKFFISSNGHCPFKSECIYLHEFPPGYRPNRRQERRRPRRRRHSPILLSDDEDDDDDMSLLQYAIALAILDDSDTGFLEYYHHHQALDFFLDTSDSDFSD